ncbi:MAG TPA: CDP-diacylglycerol--glycerol-3-phosphate 3-phosphatidyltransferase [Kiritimatiellia bacterium]|jgi:CDP-diacylglycerol--glycerol-3-phosphate 3-phosphatidyltransferase|nr:CDP-diacylglycerol--glycerol-3-phosphate 3-phosphatidyltransferase [Kiritimatiellia bacterium]
MNLPNTLTTSRLLAALVMMLAMALPIPFSSTLAFVIFVAAAITDYWDGHLARTRYGVTAFGKLMDPLADKVLVCAALVGFVGIRLPYEPAYSLVPAWVVVVIIAREFAVTGLRLLVATRDRGRIVSAGNWGKLKTVWQMVAIISTFVLLAAREDLLPFFDLSRKFLRQYDTAFVITSWILSTGVVAVTLISGWKYFADHWDLVTAEM